MKIKTSELTGAALDWAVAKCTGGQIRTEHGVFLNSGDGYEYFTPSTDWGQAGLIIEREIDYMERDGDLFQAVKYDEHGNFDMFNNVGWSAVGKSYLIAAMRAYVTSKLGSEVDVPDELTQ